MKNIVKEIKRYRIGECNIDFEIRYSKKRKRSIALSIYSTKSLVVSVPYKTQQNEINDFILSKTIWIKDKLNYFNNLNIKPLEYIQHEQHSFLGDNYRLVIIPSTKDAVKIENNNLVVYTSRIHNSYSAKTILSTWYYNQAVEHILNYSYILFNEFNIYKLSIPNVTLKKMKSRWGSCDTKGNITINTELIKTHKECIKYVLIHEFCHLLQHNHSKHFYKLLNKHMPNWKMWKKELDKYGYSIN